MFGKPARSAPDNGTVQITETAPCQKAVRLSLGREAVEPVRSAVLADFQRQATLAGFRKGKAPADLVRQQHGKAIEEETLHRATRAALEQTAKEHALKPVGPFEVTNAAFTEEGGLRLEATVEVEPAFPLAAYTGIALTRLPAEVSAEEIERSLAKLQESMAQLVPAKTGEGKERQVPALDDELAKDLGYESLAKLRAHVEAKLYQQKRASQAEALEAALCDELLKRHPFDVPPRLVAHQVERLTREFKARLMLSGVSEEQVNAEATKFTEQLRTGAERRVKLAFILDRIAEQERVGVTEAELMKRLWELARRWKKDPAEVRKLFDAQGLWASVVSSIRQEKTIAMLFSSARTSHQGGSE